MPIVMLVGGVYPVRVTAAAETTVNADVFTVAASSPEAVAVMYII